MYNKATFPNSPTFYTKALRWANQFKYCALFNPNNTKKYPFGAFKHCLGVGAQQVINSNDLPFDQLKKYLANSNKWLMGHFAYDLKNELERLNSKNEETISFPLMSFFEVEHLIRFFDESVEIISSDDPKTIYETILQLEESDISTFTSYEEIICNTTFDQYITNAEMLRQHIIEGDIYEINYCIDYSIKNLRLNPIDFYQMLCERSPTPFSTYYKCADLYALGASPERFLKKNGDQLISQPIKGTAKRGVNPTEDHNLIEALRHDEKEMAENMMIVDLVRNDLAKSSVSGSVKVEEMFGIYSFQHWHQMISTVSAKAKPSINVVDIIKNAFPMGSMTGAPKIKVMELIEKYETFKRGLYAGAIGYITPEKDFDFNVVIRTLLYDSLQAKGAFMVGSAITYDANPEKEYTECLLKARTIQETLQKLTEQNY